MNRKQKKAKRLNAKAHTKSQAQVYMTPKEVIDEKEWNQAWNHWEFGDFEAKEESSFIKGMRVGILIAFIISIVLIIHHVWW